MRIRACIIIFLLIILLVTLFFPACDANHGPKPRAYFRIALPEKEYLMFDSVFPYRFLLPAYSVFVSDTRATAEPYWANIEFPAFKATLHLSYKSVDGIDDLKTYFEDSRGFIQRHIPKATAITEELIIREEHRVFGLLYRIRGREAASPVQFFVTDSIDHFLRGALYFQVTPNNDSLAPVIGFLEEDIRLMLESLSWRE